MTRETFAAVDRYVADLLVHSDDALDTALRASEEAGLPAISVAPVQGKFLQLLAQISGARKILEIGTLGGYSTIWLARALPAGGKLLSLEVEPKHAEVARRNVERAGLAERVSIRVGKALETLPGLQGEGPFDFFFIDADKENMPGYFEWCLKLSRPGSVMVVDNVVRGGKVVEAGSVDRAVQGVRRLNELLAGEPRVSATCLQTVGMKGYDGMTIVRVL